MPGCAAVLLGLLGVTVSLRGAAKDQPAIPLRIAAPAGILEAPARVEMVCTSAAARIRFTLDNTQPSLTRGTDYHSPFGVSNTAVIRAVAFDGTNRLGPVVSHACVFLHSVLNQPVNPPGLPDNWSDSRALYFMDPRVVTDPGCRDRFKGAFAALPTLSIVANPDDLFGAAKGIYANSTEHGAGWERPCDAELISTNGATAFHVTCGIRIQGNQNRVPFKSPKHSFRILFKEAYGPTKLHCQVFSDSPVKKFNTLVLRADFNNSWIHWDASAAARGQRTRDAWMKDSHRAMGWISPHSRFVHLFLNGLYWGVYDITERPDANFAASYFGGSSDDYDVINEFQAKDGTIDAFNALHAMRDFSTPALWQRLQQSLNVTQFVDYLLLNYYAGNQDWGEDKNWYAIRRRPAGSFQYIVWDGEHILENVRDDVIASGEETPFRIVGSLKRNIEFRRLFSARAQKHCFGDGALTPAAVSARWMKRAAEVDQAMIAESARWGYVRRREPFTRDRDWIAEQNRLINDYFPNRTEILVAELKSAGLLESLPNSSSAAKP